MKLATLKNNSRDGKLVVVSRDLKKAVKVKSIAKHMQDLLDHWVELAPQLEEVYQQLNEGIIKDAIDFDQTQCESPLPRAYQWLDGSAYLNHVELVRKARGAEMPENFQYDPLMYQGGSDAFLGPRDKIEVADIDWGVDFESEVAVVTDDVPMQVSVEQAQKHIRLIALVNDVSLRNLIPNELGKNFGFLQGKPSSAFSPVAITPDELGESWHKSKVNLPLLTYYNDTMFGQPNAGADMNFDFAQLIAHAAKTRPLMAGTIIGSGTVSNKDPSKGSSCLAEKRMIEVIESGKAKTPFMQYGDRVKIEMLDQQGKTIFGSIEQTIKPFE